MAVLQDPDREEDEYYFLCIVGIDPFVKYSVRVISVLCEWEFHSGDSA